MLSASLEFRNCVCMTESQLLFDRVRAAFAPSEMHGVLRVVERLDVVIHDPVSREELQ
jgi:hypothetical protein